MSLSAAAERLRADRAEALNRCPVARLRLTLSEQDRSTLDDLMARPYLEWPSNLIIEALVSNGTKVPFEDTAMQSHRRAMRGGQGCKCRP